jgi:hypothetical protein
VGLSYKLGLAAPMDITLKKREEGRTGERGRERYIYRERGIERERE